MLVFLTVLHAAICIGLITLIMVQTSEGGLGSAFGGGEVFHTKRGVERVFFVSTIVLAILFVLTSIGNVFLG